MRWHSIGLVGSFTLGVVGFVETGQGGVIADQPNDLSNGYTSQEFTDYPQYTGSCFDDFALLEATILGSLRVFGTDYSSTGGSTNVDVVARIYLTPDLSTSAIATVSGVQSGSDLLFDLSSVTLDAGTYWLSAQVVRSFDAGGQWFWNVSSSTNGAQAMFHNPGGGFLVGTEPVPITALGATAHDMAFLLEGEPVPTPASGIAAAIGAALAWRRRRRRSG